MLTYIGKHDCGELTGGLHILKIIFKAIHIGRIHTSDTNPYNAGLVS